DLATIQSLLPGDASPTRYAQLVKSPVMRSLRAIEVWNPTTLQAFAESPAKLQHVSLTAGIDDVFEPRFYDVCRQRPDVVSTALYVRSFEDLAAQSWFERLTSLTVAASIRRGLELWPRVPPHATLAINPSPALDRCDVAFSWDTRLELRHDGVARISGNWLLQSVEVLRELPFEIHRLELEDTAEPIVERVREAVASRGLEIAFRGLIGRAGNYKWWEQAKTAPGLR